MPTYVYRCAKGHEFELFHGIKDETPKRCPKCKSRAKRVPAAGGGFLFKGSGFYATDYRSDSYRQAAKAETSEKGGSTPPSGGASGGGAPSSAGGSSPPSGGPKAPGGSTGESGKRRKRGGD